jgi:pimeloyl-ACP methyl ester carboxylesterase
MKYGNRRLPRETRQETRKVREIPTVVLMPGLICDGQFWTARAALEQLAPARLQVRVADFSRLSSIGAMADKVVGETAGPIVAIGHSMGGRVALEVLRRAPERVVGLALLNTGIHTLRDGEEAKRAELVRLAYEQGMAALADRWVPPMVDPRRKDDAALLAPMKQMVMRATPEQHERQIRALLDRPDPRDLLPRIACPTLVMVGRQDQWSPVAQHEEIAALIPGAKLVIIEDAGHMSQMERPEETTAALVQWLREAVLQQEC